jgi:hypothetical protein
MISSKFDLMKQHRERVSREKGRRIRRIRLAGNSENQWLLREKEVDDYSLDILCLVLFRCPVDCSPGFREMQINSVVSLNALRNPGSNCAIPLLARSLMKMLLYRFTHGGLQSVETTIAENVRDFGPEIRNVVN